MHTLEVALIGFPGSGKTTLWNLLTNASRPTGDYSGRARIDKGVFVMPDERLERFRAALGSKKTVPFHVEIHDVTGLISMTGGRAEVSDELLNTVRNADLIVLVLRAFPSPGHPGGPPDPKKELAALLDELHFRDISLLENRIRKIEDTVKKPVPNRDELLDELALCKRLLETVEAGKRPDPVSLTDADRKSLGCYRLFSLAAFLVFLNTGGETNAGSFDTGGLPVVAYPAAMEAELAGFQGAELAAMRKDLGLEPSLSEVFAAGIKKAADIIFFYTGNEREAHVWALKRGKTALDAAAAIHTDIAQGFIRADVASVEDIIQSRGWGAARKAGKFRPEGREYTVRDADAFDIRFSK